MTLTLVTCIRDEGPFILEWLAHHRAMGVDRFLIYTNDCTDGSDGLLAALDRAGIVVHVPRTLKPQQSPQWSALKAAWEHEAVTSADWLMVSDVDEFADCAAPSLPDLIAQSPDGTQGIALPWRLFGNAGIVPYEDADIAPRFTRRGRDGYYGTIGSTFFKSVFARSGPFTQFGVHRPRQKEGARPLWIDGTGAHLPEVFTANDKRISLLRLMRGAPVQSWVNHYSLRSAESFLAKAVRGLPSSRKKAIDLAYWVERNFNHVEDTSITRRAAETARARAALEALPGVRDAHEACVAAHRQIIARELKRPEAYALFRAMLIAGSSSGVPIPLGNRLIRLWQDVEKN